MSIYCLTNMSMDSCIEALFKIPPESIVCIGFDTVGFVDLVNELNGKTANINKLCQLADNYKITIIAGIYAETYTKSFTSVIVIDKGTIVGMSDMTHSLDAVSDLGNAFRIYQIDDKNIGVIVGDDIFFPEVVRALAINSCDYLISIGNLKINQSLITVLKCHSLLNGLSIITLTEEGIIVTDYKGQYALINRDNCVKVNVETEHNDYYLRCVREDIYDNVFMEKKK